MSAYVALLRGINVGGKRIVPMKSLAAMFVEARCTGVTTYVQSGNVVFHASQAVMKRAASVVEAALEEQFGFAVRVLTRSASDLDEVVSHNPFIQAGADPATTHVGFLADRPAVAAVAALDARRSPPDRFAVRGREVYLHLPNGVARSKLTNVYFDAKLGTVCTVRNWRTVTALAEMLRS